MCLLVLAWQRHPRYRLIVAANRDEYHARAAEPAAVRAAAPEMLAGRDLQAGGTWLGVARSRRIGIVTNFRERARPRRRAPSRGALIPGFLQSAAPQDFIAELETEAPGYAGFNLLLGDAEHLWYLSNRGDEFARDLAPGLHGLSNHFLDTPWPKLRRVRDGLAALLDDGRFDAADRKDAAPMLLLDLLADRQRVPPAELTDTGLGAEWEEVLSAPFVLHPEYGTRCSTAVLIGHDDSLQFVERRFGPTGAVTGEEGWRLDRTDWPGVL